MLDQNTDRMWFVIGAVIVGAAIIFIANGTLPDLFASVTDSFEGASNEALAVVAEIGESKNYVSDGLSERALDKERTDYTIDLAGLREIEGRTVEVTFDAWDEGGDHRIDLYLRRPRHIGTYEKGAVMSTASHVYRIDNTPKTYTYRFVVPSLEEYDEYYLTFRGSKYVPGSGNHNDDKYYVDNVSMRLVHTE